MSCLLDQVIQELVTTGAVRRHRPMNQVLMIRASLVTFIVACIYPVHVLAYPSGFISGYRVFFYQSNCLVPVHLQAFPKSNKTQGLCLPDQHRPSWSRSLHFSPDPPPSLGCCPSLPAEWQVFFVIVVVVQNHNGTIKLILFVSVNREKNLNKSSRETVVFSDKEAKVISETWHLHWTLTRYNFLLFVFCCLLAHCVFLGMLSSQLLPCYSSVDRVAELSNIFSAILATLTVTNPALGFNSSQIFPFFQTQLGEQGQMTDWGIRKPCTS